MSQSVEDCAFHGVAIRLGLVSRGAALCWGGRQLELSIHRKEHTTIISTHVITEMATTHSIGEEILF